jgi:hypothetical protein
MPPIQVFFCRFHPRQNLDRNGRCPWCDLTPEQQDRMKTAGGGKRTR